MRLALMGGALAALATLYAVPAGAQGSSTFAYAPGTQHYRLTTEVHRDQNMGGGRAPFEFNATTTQFVTLELARQSPDTMRLTITLDSVHVKSDLDAPAPDTRKLFGKKLTGYVSPQGRVYSFSPPPGTNDPQVVALYRVFKNFLLPLPDKPLAVGTSWADTTTEKVNKDGFDITAHAITTSKVAGDTTVNGQHALRIERRSYIAQSGEKNEAGYPIHLTGEGSMTGVHVLSPTGVYLGSQSTQRFNITMLMKESEGAPINQTIKSKVERVGS
jgi:hypothetical protein